MLNIGAGRMEANANGSELMKMLAKMAQILLLFDTLAEADAIRLVEFLRECAGCVEYDLNGLGGTWKMVAEEYPIA